jgi:hypothetical protein
MLGVPAEGPISAGALYAQIAVNIAKLPELLSKA